MDLRAKKTRSSIISAFLELRSKKPLEKITIKELSELAMINKATFYLHFKDIYDLSDFLEEKLVDSVIKGLSMPERFVEDPGGIVTELTEGYIARYDLLRIVFEGKQSDHLVRRIEDGIKKALFEKRPEWKDNTQMNVFLSFCICGSYYSFLENMHRGESRVVSQIARMTEAVAACVKDEQG